MVITEAIADQFVKEFARRHHVLVVEKDDRIEAQIVARCMDIARSLGAQVPSGDEFLRRYSTTIAVGPLAVIYLVKNLTPIERVVVMTHEMEHVFQARRGEFKDQTGLDGHKLGGGFEMIALYLFEDTEARCRYESMAYRAGLEVSMIQLEQPAPSLESLVHPLEGGYNLSVGAKQLALDAAESNLVSVSMGIAVTQAGCEGIEILRGLV